MAWYVTQAKILTLFIYFFFFEDNGKLLLGHKCRRKLFLSMKLGIIEAFGILHVRLYNWLAEHELTRECID